MHRVHFKDVGTCACSAWGILLLLQQRMHERVPDMIAEVHPQQIKR